MGIIRKLGKWDEFRIRRERVQAHYVTARKLQIRNQIWYSYLKLEKQYRTIYKKFSDKRDN